MERAAKDSEKMQNASKLELILRHLYQRYSDNRHLISDVKCMLLKKSNVSRLLMIRNEFNWAEFPVL